MGMYTEFFFRAELRQGVIAERATQQLHSIDNGVAFIDDDPFFKTPRWRMLFQGGSAYFPTRGFEFEYCPSENRYRVFIHSSFKCYDNEIALFLDWIDHIVDALPGEFLGYSLYEEDEQPTLYYKKG